MRISASERLSFLARHQLPAAYIDLADKHFRPLLPRLAELSRQRPIVVGLNGCQGSGKTTMADYLACSLNARRAGSAVVLSLDDFYLSRADRAILAQNIHPLLATRGVPGTHDTAMLLSCIDALLAGDVPLSIPQFSKADDERRAAACWPTIDVAPSIIIFEGWCVGVKPQSAAQLMLPCNAMESEQDPDGVWRGFANDQLAGEYAVLFSRINYLVHLAAPGFDCVARWRAEQEHKLAKSSGGTALMNDSEIEQFVQHFQRLTEHSLATMPSEADHTFHLRRDQGVRG